MNIDAVPTLIVITGPTAVGKSDFAIRIASSFNAEILSADSRQFYSEMRIGTARPPEEDLIKVPHHFIGHLSIHDYYNVSMFEQEALRKMEELFLNSRVALLVGGSGLYIDAVCKGIDDLPDPDDATRKRLKMIFREQGLPPLVEQLKALDPDYYQTVDQSNPKRILRALEVCLSTGVPYSSLRLNKPKKRDFQVIKVGLTMDRQLLYNRINSRVDQMMEDGLLEEARALYPFRDLNALNTVGYKELFAFFDNQCTFDFALEKIKTNTRRFAKRQMTWFGRDDEITWFRPKEEEEVGRFIMKRMDNG
ncbi:MAG: tRNA (adenosine(37)-N6)-dimethylallyltransferase MiaA [Bacteroidota bacterium]